jgi:hypothetical protein
MNGVDERQNSPYFCRPRLTERLGHVCEQQPTAAFPSCLLFARKATAMSRRALGDCMRSRRVSNCSVKAAGGENRPAQVEAPQDIQLLVAINSPSTTAI